MDSRRWTYTPVLMAMGLLGAWWLGCLVCFWCEARQCLCAWVGIDRRGRNRCCDGLSDYVETKSGRVGLCPGVVLSQVRMALLHCRIGQSPWGCACWGLSWCSLDLVHWE
jgi:hypothetical protein